MNPFRNLKGSGATAAELAADVRAAEAALSEVERHAGELAGGARAAIVEALADGKDSEKNIRDRSGEIEAARLRADAMRTGIENLKSKLRARLESEHADARRAAEKIIAECAKEDANLAREIVPAAVKLLRLAVQRRGRKIGKIICIQVFAAATGAMLTPGPAAWQFLEGAAKEGDETAKALTEAVMAEIPDNAERKAAARAIFDSGLDIDAQIARLLPPPPPGEVPVKPANVEPGEYGPYLKYERGNETPHGGGNVRLG